MSPEPGLSTGGRGPQWAPPGTEDEGLREKLDLKADCASCFGLCCVALPFAASADFAIDKDAGRAVPATCGTTSAAASTRDLRAARASRAAPSTTASAPGRRSSRSPSAGGTGGGRRTRPRRMFERLPGHAPAPRAALVPGRGADAAPPARRSTASSAPRCDETERLTAAAPTSWRTLDVAAHRRRSTPCCCGPANSSGPGAAAGRRSRGAPTSSAANLQGRRPARAPTCAAPT